MTFLHNTLKEFCIALCLLAFGYFLTSLLQRLDPTVGILDPGIFLVLLMRVTTLYLAAGIGHGIFRLIFPTMADHADTGGFRGDWQTVKRPIETYHATREALEKGTAKSCTEQIALALALRGQAWRRLWLVAAAAAFTFTAALAALLLL